MCSDAVTTKINNKRTQTNPKYKPNINLLNLKYFIWEHIF